MTHEDAYRPLTPADPEYHQALDQFHATYGINAEQTLLPHHWRAAMLWGLPRIFFNDAGWGAITLLLGPRPLTHPHNLPDWSTP